MMMLGALVRMLSVLELESDWSQLARVYNDLRQIAAPSRDKLSRLVRASDLFELGLRLMDTCEKESDRPAYVATPHRDGLIIALLIACPMRIKNLADLVIGQHLVFEGQAYVVKVSAAGTKAGRPYHAAIPLGLTPYIDGWLQVTASFCNQLQGRKAWAAVPGVTSGSIATAARCEAERSGSRSKPAPNRHSRMRSGRTCSGTAP